MATAYEMLELGPDASREDLEAAYAAKRALYAAERHANLPDEFQQLAALRRTQMAEAYHSLRIALAAPARLPAEAERHRERETIFALAVLVAIALLVPLLRDVAVPQRAVQAAGAEAAELTAEIAPAFTLKAIDGQQVSLADYQGQVVLINLWATWCPPCVRETPRLVRLHDKYRDQGFTVLSVNTTYQDELAKVQQFVRDQNMRFPVLLDVEDKFGAAYRARVLPTSYLIDRDGNIVQVRVGEVDEAQLDEQIAGLLQHDGKTP